MLLPLNHKHIACYYGSMVSDRIRIVMEGTGTSLSTFIRERTRSSLPDRMVYRIAYEASDAIAFLETRQIVHGLISMSAFCISPPPNYTIKLGLLGLAPRVFNKAPPRTFLPWLPPESLFTPSYTIAGDVWSFGVFLWEVWSVGALPRGAYHTAERMLNDIEGGVRLPQPTDCSTAVYELMQQCWMMSQRMRPTPTYIKQTIRDLVVASYGSETDAILLTQTRTQSSSQLASMA